MVQAEAYERVSEQTVFFHRVVACRANSIGPVIHSLQRGIHFAERIHKRSRRSFRRCRRDRQAYFLAPFFKLLSNIRIGHSGHGSLLHFRRSRNFRRGAIRFGHGIPWVSVFYSIRKADLRIPQLSISAANLRPCAQPVLIDVRTALAASDKRPFQYSPSAWPAAAHSMRRAKLSQRDALLRCGVRNKSPIVRRLKFLRANAQACLAKDRARAKGRLRVSQSAPAISSQPYRSLGVTPTMRSTARSACGLVWFRLAVRISVTVRIAQIHLFPPFHVPPAAI